MSKPLYIVPVAGARIRQPERGYEVLPAEGAWVTPSPYWQIQLDDGTVRIVEPPAAPKPAVTA